MREPQRITFALGGLDRELAPRQLATLLECLTWAHAFYLHRFPQTPPASSLLSSGRLRLDAAPTGFRDEGQEDWQDIPTALVPRPDGIGRIDDRSLAAWCAAELRMRTGEDAKAVVLTRPGTKGRLDMRAAVKRANGTVEDPAFALDGGTSWRPIGMRRWPDRHRVTFVLDLFGGPHQRVLSHATLQCMLDALTDIDGRYLRRHLGKVPLLYRAGVRYEEEPPGQEDWQDVATTIRAKVGDCDDFSCWRAAELRALYGVDARATFKDQTRSNGTSLYHIVTMLPEGVTTPLSNGQIEDPSRVLGMR